MRDIQYRDDGRPEDLLQELGYETQDIQYKKFGVYGMYFFGFFIFCVISGFVFMFFMSPTKLHGGKMADSVPKTDMPLAAPLLQSNITARTDIMSLRRNEAAAMDSAGVIDKGHGVYRIPIDQAIDDVAKESDADKAAMGLQTQTADQKNVDISTGTDANGKPAIDPSQGIDTDPMLLEPAGGSSRPNNAVRGGRTAANQVSNAGKSPSNTHAGESATTQPKGGNGG
jgi:hypothetical protein